MAEGVVKALWRFPVLGMRGEDLRSSQIDTRGLAGDRQHFARGPEGPLNAQDIPRLARWTATFPFNPDGAIVPDRPPPFPVFAGPDGQTWRWRDPRLFRALERDLRRPVDLQRDLKLTRGVIVTTAEPTEAAAELGINVYLDLELPGSGWAGRELAFGEGVRLRLVASRADGPGIEARVVESGRILVGDSVALS